MDKEHFNDEFEALDELHKNELDDIVLEKYEKKEKIKKYAIIAGSLLAVFFVVIMIVKVVSDSSSAPQDSLVEEKLVQEEPVEEAGNEEFEEVPVVTEDENETENLDSVIQEVLNKEKSLAMNEATTPAPPPVQTPPKSEPKQTKPPVKKVQTPTVKKTKKEPPRRVQKTAPKPKTATATGHYFIQVGAFLKQDPDKRFLQKIKANGFSYKVKTFYKNGQMIKRVYVGPFKSRSEAKKVLAKVRKTITPGAFIVRL